MWIQDDQLDLDFCEAIISSVFYLPSRIGYHASPTALRVGTSSSVSRQYSVLYVSRVLSEIELLTNLFAHTIGGDVRRVSAGRLYDAEWERSSAAVSKLRDLDFSVVHPGELSVQQLHDWVRLTAQESIKSPFVILDDELLLEELSRTSLCDKQACLAELSEIASNNNASIALVEYESKH
jgi:replicative DNA helicase